MPPTSAARPAESPADRTTESCLHCGLRLRGRHVGTGFCCSGCRTVYDLIHTAGLDRYYELKTGVSAPGPEASPNSGRFEWLDTLTADSRGTDGGKLLELQLDLQGIHCAACVWLVDELFGRYAGGIDLRINPAMGQADLVWDPKNSDLREFLAEAERFGYRFGPRHEGRSHGSRSLAIRMGVTLGLASQVMMFSLPFYLGLVPADGSLYTILGLVNFVLATLVVGIGGWVFFRAAVLGLQRGLVHLDLPIATGITLAYAASVVGYLRSGPESTYFDTVSIFVALMLVGRWLQESVLNRNRNTILADGGIADLRTRRFQDGDLATIPVAGVHEGDELWVVPGDILPVDATVIHAGGDLSLDWITGESEPRRHEPGGSVPAGARNIGISTIRFRSEQDFDASRLGTLLSTPGAERRGGDALWRRVGSVYAVGILVLGAAGFALWVGHGLEKALAVTASVLVVTCPCALGLAVPLAHELTTLGLRRQGVFLRDAGFLDRALRVRKVVFDKTGTLTLNRLRLTEASRSHLETLSDSERTVLANMSVRSNHPASRAIAAALTGMDDPPVEWLLENGNRVVEHAGQGLAWRHEDRDYRLGRTGLAATSSARSEETAGPSETVFSVDGRTLTRLAFEESLKEGAVEEIRTLESMGVTSYLSSGDRSDRVDDAARRLGIPAERRRGAMTPEAKAEWVRELDRDDTLMIGDGINDAPAFSVAFAAGTPAVDHPTIPARADFYFLGNRIHAVAAALRAARRLRSVTRGNLAFAVAYNATALTLCYLGLIGPLAAAVLMPISSAAVVSLTGFRITRRIEP